MVTRKKLLKLALIFAILCAVFFVLNYFCYHYTDDANSDKPGEGRFFFTEYHEDCRKPFVTDLLGQMGCFWLFSAVTSLICAFVITDDKKKVEDKEKATAEEPAEEIAAPEEDSVEK